MKTEKPLLGLCPIGKFVFSNEDAVRQKRLIQDKLAGWGVSFVDLDGLLEDGLVKDQSHVDRVVEHFRSSKVDCLFMPHCNFGTEGAVGMIAAKLGLPVLLWGPRDERPLGDGTRLRDTLCGMFASSKVLHKLKVPFTYIANCRVDEEPLKKGLDVFLRAANVAKAFRRGMRIGHIGQRIDFFWTTIVNESELLERFNVQIVPIDMVDFIHCAKAKAERDKTAYLAEVAQIRKDCRVEGFPDDTPLMNVLAVRDRMLELGKDLALDGFAVQDFMSLCNELGAYCFFADGMVADRYAVGYESDIHGTISDVILRRASLGERPAFLADLTVRHPDNDNSVLLWHCGAAASLRHEREKVTLGKHWILPSELSGMPHFRLKDGPITVARFDGDHGRYQLAVGEGHSVEGPRTLNNYVWMQVDDWPRWERTLMNGPFMHHIAMTYGHYADALTEACTYIPSLEAVRLDRCR